MVIGACLHTISDLKAEMLGLRQSLLNVWYIFLQNACIIFLMRSKIMLDHFSFHLSQKGPAILFATLAFLFCGALLLGFL